MRRIVAPPGQALPDWEIFARTGRALGHREQFAWTSAAAVFDEYVGTTDGRLCDQTGLSHRRLADEGPLQWPVPSRGPAGDAHSGTDRLYASRRFPTPDGRARLAPTPHAEPVDAPDDEFPLVLTTGRVAHQWHTMTRTGKAKDLLAAEPEPFVEVHPDDAARCTARDGDAVVVRSRRGRATLKLRVSDAVPRGTAFAPFHWGALNLTPGAGALNGVVARAVDPTSLQAELKATAVRLEPVGVEARRGGRRRRLVVVGAGMAGTSTVEALLAHASHEDWSITVVGAEPERPYNRILLSQVLAGAVAEHELDLRRPAWFAEHGIDLRLGVAARLIDTAARTVELADGERLEFDDLVVATGSEPFVPPVAGADHPRVHVLRTRADARAILDAAARARRAVVIGGGLLGLEAARALRARGLRTTVVHLADRLMELQLDGPAAGMLERALRDLRIGIRTRAMTEAITDEEVVLAGGETLPADLVVIAAGIRPHIALARSAGLEVGRGVLVDDELRTSARGVRAVGECAEHRGTVYGLWAPLQAQARALGASLAGRPAAFLGAPPATTLKVAGIDLFCCGRVAAQPRDEEVLSLDTRRGRYRRLLIDEDARLAGAILLGDLREAKTLRRLLADRERVPDALLADAGPPATEDRGDPDLNVCSCQGVTRGEIADAIRERRLTTVAEVAEHTRASTGCGGCRADVEALLARAG
jgi:ferredoxin-nitrate reductase